MMEKKGKENKNLKMFKEKKGKRKKNQKRN